MIDEDIAKQDAALLRRRIGYVIQHAGLFPHRTVQDNIATVPMLHGVNKKQARKDARKRAATDQPDASPDPPVVDEG